MALVYGVVSEEGHAIDHAAHDAVPTRQQQGIRRRFFHSDASLGATDQCRRADKEDVFLKQGRPIDNGSSYISGDLADWLEDQGMDHVRGAQNHPQTQGEIERWHQTLKNRILLENYCLPGALEDAIRAFVDHYNHRRYHESLGNLTPADVYFGRSEGTLKERSKTKQGTLKQLRLLNLGRAA